MLRVWRLFPTRLPRYSGTIYVYDEKDIAQVYNESPHIYV